MVDLKIRTCTVDDLREHAALVRGVFLQDVEEEAQRVRQLVAEPERIHVAVDGERLVATAGVFTREMTVPGGPIPVAHVTGVGVAPTHRRRGLLTALMNEQLAAISDRGTEPVAALWASEGSIYGRFGYGLASWNVTYAVAAKETSVPGETPPGRLWQAVPSEVRDTLAEVHERARAGRPGVSARPGAWWENRTTDAISQRGGLSAERAVVYDGDSGAQGYALWRVKGGWSDTGPDGEVLVTEVMAESLEAYTALWRFLLSIDLVRTVRCRFAAIDETLAHLVTNADALGATVGPGLWVRVVDVPGALAVRRYAVPIDVVLEVTDARMPANQGRWHVSGDRESATCEPTTAAPDLTLDVRELGSAYLGGMTLASLAAAGRVTEHRTGALAAASAAFGWDRAPWSNEMF